MTDMDATDTKISKALSEARKYHYDRLAELRVQGPLATLDDAPAYRRFSAFPVPRDLADDMVRIYQKTAYPDPTATIDTRDFVPYDTLANKPHGHKYLQFSPSNSSCSESFASADASHLALESARRLLNEALNLRNENDARDITDNVLMPLYRNQFGLEQSTAEEYALQDLTRLREARAYYLGQPNVPTLTLEHYLQGEALHRASHEDKIDELHQKRIAEATEREIRQAQERRAAVTRSRIRTVAAGGLLALAGVGAAIVANGRSEKKDTPEKPSVVAPEEDIPAGQTLREQGPKALTDRAKRATATGNIER